MVCGSAATTPNAFVRIGTDDTVTIIVKHVEFGQGPFLGLSTLVAEELDADWSKMRAEHAPADAKIYAVSCSVLCKAPAASSYEFVRADAARRRLRASCWCRRPQAPGDIPASEAVDSGVIQHASGRKGTFGEFVAAASKMRPPAADAVKLKDPASFKLIGKDHLRRLDWKTNGTARYTIDIHEPGLLVAVVASPRFGARVASVDSTKAAAVPGVVAIKQIPTGVAVYANATWPAIRARQLCRFSGTIARPRCAVPNRSSKVIARPRARLESSQPRTAIRRMR